MTAQKKAEPAAKAEAAPKEDTTVKVEAATEIVDNTDVEDVPSTPVAEEIVELGADTVQVNYL